jgi:hypothetical protein
LAGIWDSREGGTREGALSQALVQLPVLKGTCTARYKALILTPPEA